MSHFEECRFGDIKYIVHYPEDYKEGEKRPVILFLHGAGTRGEDLGVLKGNCYFSLTAEHECTKQIADFIADFTLGDIVYGLEYGEFLVEQRCLVLRKITYLHIMAQLQRALVLKLLHYTFYKR